MFKHLFNILIVGAGGFVGTASRYLANIFIKKLAQNSHFPYGTIVVNILGCFLIGLLNGYADSLGIFSSRIRLFLFIGLLGGFTTFSAFSYETFTLLRNQELSTAFLNIILNILLCLLFVYCGYAIPTHN